MSVLVIHSHPPVNLQFFSLSLFPPSLSYLLYFLFLHFNHQTLSPGEQQSHSVWIRQIGRDWCVILLSKATCRLPALPIFSFIPSCVLSLSSHPLSFAFLLFPAQFLSGRSSPIIDSRLIAFRQLLSFPSVLPGCRRSSSRRPRPSRFSVPQSHISTLSFFNSLFRS